MKKIEITSAILFTVIFVVSALVFFTSYHIHQVAIFSCISLLISGEIATIQIGRLFKRRSRS